MLNIPDKDHPLYELVKKMKEIDDKRTTLLKAMQLIKAEKELELAKFKVGDKVVFNDGHPSTVFFVSSRCLSTYADSGIFYQLRAPKKDGTMSKKDVTAFYNVDQSRLKAA